MSTTSWLHKISTGKSWVCETRMAARPWLPRLALPGNNLLTSDAKYSNCDANGLLIHTKLQLKSSSICQASHDVQSYQVCSSLVMPVPFTWYEPENPCGWPFSIAWLELCGCSFNGKLYIPIIRLRSRFAHLQWHAGWVKVISKVMLSRFEDVHTTGCPYYWMSILLDVHTTGCPYYWMSILLDVHTTGTALASWSVAVVRNQGVTAGCMISE